MLKTNNKFYHLLRAVRPRQWIKNSVVFAPIIFHGKLFVDGNFFKETLAFIYFSGIASDVYLINDIKDAEKDRLHPIKKNRPIASGALPVSWAWATVILLFAVFIPTSFIFVSTYFGIILLVYIAIQIAYNLKLKEVIGKSISKEFCACAATANANEKIIMGNAISSARINLCFKEVIILDALTIAMGFILRVFAGALAIPVSISSWLILAITGVSLLLAFGKRRAERTLLEAKGLSRASIRSILKNYPDNLLDSMISMSASFSIITYSLFAFQVSPDKEVDSALQLFLPSTLIGAKFLMLTIPIVIYGVARYLYVIYEKREGESPERILMEDKPLLYAAILWGILVILITNY